jgi:hypothetical protein
MLNGVVLAFSSPSSEESEDEFNRWYSEQHLGEMAAVPGVVSAARYRLLPTELAGAGPSQGYVAIYELTAQTPEEMSEFIAGLQAAASAGRVTLHEAVDVGSIGTGFCLPIGERIVGVGA